MRMRMRRRRRRMMMMRRKRRRKMTKMGGQRSGIWGAERNPRH
jgi:hypothetical protein